MLAALTAEIAEAERAALRRRSLTPSKIEYPEELPITAWRADLLGAIRDHQVVVVAGETGSGKSTQLPKLCLELGRGVEGLIGHTQPRRIAARSIAERVAEELGSVVGGLVGYTVRFTDQVGEDTLVKVMTDGILLAEIHSDRRLASLRHDHPRRGPRAQSQHRLPARLPHDAPAQTAGPEADRHVGDHRHRPLRRATSATRPSWRSRVAPTRSSCATARSTTLRPVSRVISRRPSATPCRSSPPRAPATSWCSAPGSARSGTQRRYRRAGASPHRDPAAVRPALVRRTASGVRSAHGPTDRAGHQRGRDLADRARYPIGGRPRHGPDLALQPAHQGAAASHRADLAGVGQPAGRSLRTAGARRVHPPLRRRRLRSGVPSSPSPRSCAPISPR